MISLSAYGSTGFDYSEISIPKDNPCENILRQEQLKRLALKKLTDYCDSQNKALKDMGYPSCQRGECFQHLSFGRKQGIPLEIQMSNSLTTQNIYIGFIVYLDRESKGLSISCKEVSMNGPFTLDQLDQLRDYISHIESLNHCSENTSI